MRAALNAVARMSPDWLQALIPMEWFERSGQRVKDDLLRSVSGPSSLPS